MLISVLSLISIIKIVITLIIITTIAFLRQCINPTSLIVSIRLLQTIKLSNRHERSSFHPIWTSFTPDRTLHWSLILLTRYAIHKVIILLITLWHFLSVNHIRISFVFKFWISRIFLKTDTFMTPIVWILIQKRIYSGFSTSKVRWVFFLLRFWVLHTITSLTQVRMFSFDSVYQINSEWNYFFWVSNWGKEVA